MKQKSSIKDVLSYDPRSTYESSVVYAKPTIPTNSFAIPLEPDFADTGDFFPAKIAITFGMAQFLCGILLVTFGAMSIVIEASMSDIGAGLWTGTIIIVSGMLGIMAGKRPTCTIYIIAFMTLAILSIAVSGLLVVFSSMGLVKDQNHPYGFYVDDQGNRVEFLGEVPLKSPAIAINTCLVILGILSVLLALGSTIICGREACQCYFADSEFHQDDLTIVDSMVRRNRIMNWLGQQDTNDPLTSLSSSVNPVNHPKVHPIAIGVIPKINANPQSSSTKSSKLCKPSKNAVSQTTSSSTLRSELENDLKSDFIDRNFLLFGRDFSYNNALRDNTRYGY